MLNTPRSMPSYVAREFTDRVIVTIRINNYEMFGVIKHYKRKYIFSIYLSKGQRDHIMCHFGARYYAELEGQQLSAEIKISEDDKAYLKHLEPVGRERRRYKYYR